MNWDDLQLALELSRNRTLVATAAVLRVNHTTISRRLRGLEESVGVRLFDKTPSGYMPTAAGEQLVASAARMEEEALALATQVLGQDARLQGPLRVATIDVFAHRHADELRLFSDRYPEVQLELTVDNALHNLSRREADVALRGTNRPDDYLVGRKLATMEMAVYGARALVAERPEGTPLSAYPWIDWDARYAAPVTRAWMARHVSDARIAATVDSGLLMVELVRRGLGLAHLACIDGDRDPRLVRMCPVEPGFGQQLWLLTHPALRHTARVRAFMEIVGTAIAARAEEFEGRGSVAAQAGL